LVQVTVVPTLTVRVSGVKVKLTILTSLPEVDVTVVGAVVLDVEQPETPTSNAADNIRMIAKTINFFIFHLV
jgi:hypothetical protein